MADTLIGVFWRDVDCVGDVILVRQPEAYEGFEPRDLDRVAKTGYVTGTYLSQNGDYTIRWHLCAI